MGYVVVIGSSNTDLVVRVPHLPHPGETVLGNEYRQVAGGKGANQAVAAAVAGGSVAFVACLGRDPFGDKALTTYQEAGIDTTYLVRTDVAPSGVALIYVDDQGENCIAVASGANLLLSPHHVEAAEPAISTADMMLVQLEIPLDTVISAAQRAAERDLPVILNPAPAQVLPSELWTHLTVLTPNREELSILTGLPVDTLEAVYHAAEQILERGPEAVMVTLGKEGVLVFTTSEVHHLPAYPVDAVDTTGAGDVFNGALAVALSDGAPYLEAAAVANAAAAISVTRPGAQPSIPNRDEIIAMLQSG